MRRPRPRAAWLGARAAPTLAVVLALAAFWLYFHVAPPRPSFHAYNADPEVAYLLTSLAVYKGQPYVFVEHPGITLAVAGTLVLAPARPFFRGADTFVTALLRRPDPFFVIVHALMGGASVLCMLKLARYAVPRGRDAKGWLGAAVAASFLAVLPDAPFWTFFWSHNAPAFPLGTPLLLATMLALRRRRVPGAGLAFALGLGAGTLAATTLYLAAWALGPAAAPLTLALCGRVPVRRALASAGAVAAGAVTACLLWFLPMAQAYPRFAAFVHGLLTHQGAYGTGELGLTTWARWTANLRGLAAQAPALFLALASVTALLGLALLAERGHWRVRAGEWAMAAALVLQMVVLLAVLGKHPGAIYLPAVAAILPPLLALTLAAWRRRGRAGTVVCAALAACAFAGLAFNLARDVRSHQRRLRFRVEMDHHVDAARRRAAAEWGRPPLLLWGPLLPDAGCYALWMGEQYTGGALGAEISAVCPDEGLAWSNFVAVPLGRGHDQPALLVTTERAPILFPAFRALGPPELSPVRDPAGYRLAFYRVAVRDRQVLELGSALARP